MKRLRCFEAVARLPEPVGNARRAWSERRSRALLWSGPWGTALGEAAPLPGHSLESYAAACEGLRQLEQIALPPLPARGSWLTWCSSLDEWCPELPAAARCALETCALDAAARAEGLPLCEWLAPGSASAPVERCALVDLWRSDDAFLGSGMPQANTLKVKLGKELPRELSRLRHLRARWPGRCWRADANRGLSEQQLPAVLATLAELGIEFIEEPCPLSRLGAPRSLPCPLALDESLAHEPELARQWLLAGRVRAVVLKPMLLGGLAETLRWVELARAGGAAVVLSHLFDGSIAAQLYDHLARAYGTPGVAAGLGPHPGLKLFADRVASAPQAGGLGLTWVT